MAWPFSRREKYLKLAFWKVREELNEHLETINQNTNEIQEAFEVLAKIETKLDRIDARLEKLEMEKSVLGKNLIQLSLREEEVFALLYTAGNKITANDIADRLSLPEEIVNNMIYNLLAKGIPVLKHISEGKMFVYLDRNFREQQAKNPVVHISRNVIAALSDDK